jgi:MFS family permease
MSAVAINQTTELEGTYWQKVRQFSWNARLYLLHIVGMDTIYGTWSVVFNLYLLAIGFDAAFIGTRLAIAGIVGAFASIPAGIISDRIGRKASFILGDGMGALMSLVNIMTLNPTILLITPIISGIFGNLHGVSEPAFMAENSKRAERVHLFSVSSGTRTLAVMIGSLITLTFPFMLTLGYDIITVYRVSSFIGITLWFLSLVPAILLRADPQGDEPMPKEKRSWRESIVHPNRVFQLTMVEGLIAFGAAFVIPLFSVYFHDSALHAHDEQIGGTFALGSFVLGFAALLSPVVAQRLGKVRSVFVLRMLAVPFVVILAFAPHVDIHYIASFINNVGSLLSIATFAYVMRTVFFNMSIPIFSAFSMEALDPGERGATIGIQSAVASLAGAIGGYFGGQWMAAHDFQTPLLLMAGFYFVSNLLFWRYFKTWEQQAAQQPALAKTATASAGR